LLSQDSKEFRPGDVILGNDAYQDKLQEFGSKKKKNAPTKEQIEKER